MPRNGSGTYSLPVSPFVALTTISPTDVNSDFSDIATALTQSIATTGTSSISAAIPFFTGTAGAPGITFAGHLLAGMAADGGGNLYLCNNGSYIFKIDSTGLTSFLSNWQSNGTANIYNTLSISGVLTASGPSFFTSTCNITAPMILSSTFTVSAPATASSTFTFSGKLKPTNTIEIDASDLALGQCRLNYTSSTVLTLTPLNGNLLFISTKNQAIPSAGVTLSNSGVANSTFYYIYAYMNSGTMTLEYSTTAPAVSTTNGIKIKNGDSTRTLVGAAYVDASGTWKDANGTRYVLTHFNRRNRTSLTTFSTSRTSVAATPTEINTEIRNQFIIWSDEQLQTFFNSQMTSTSAVADITTGIAVDSNTTPNAGAASCRVTVNGPTWTLSDHRDYDSALTEAAVHYVTMTTQTTVGTTTFIANGTNYANVCIIGITLNG